MSTTEQAGGVATRRSRRRFRSNWALNVGATIIVLSCAAALLAPVIAPYAPTKMAFGSELVAPSATFPFGTDDLGRDILSRVLYGIRSSFAVVVPAVALAAFVGVGTGMALGYYGGWLDILVTRAYDMLMAFPALLLAIVMIAFLGPSYLNLVLSLALLSVSGFAVLARSATLSARSSEYVQAAVALGAGSGRIMIVHLLRNLAPVITTQAALTLSILILVEASLAFLGIGVQPPTPSLGGMLNAAQTYMTIAPWLALAPGLTIMVVVVGFNLLADGIRDRQGRPTA